METLLETNESLPITVLPDFMRGVSQFNKSGALHFVTEKVEGYIHFHEGRMLSFGLSNASFEALFLDRLCQGGVIPSNVHELFLEEAEDLGVREIMKVLVFHGYLSEEESVRFYEASVQELLFSLLEEKNGHLFFQYAKSKSFHAGEGDHGVLFNEEESFRGLYPCQFLLDYVESTLIAEELCREGEYLQRADETSPSDIFLDADEKRMLALAEAHYSVTRVLESVCDTRQNVFRLLLHLKNTGVIFCTAGSDSEGQADAAVETGNTGEGMHSDERKDSIIEREKDQGDNSYFDKINLYLMRPKGIELVLTFVMPAVILAGLYYFQHIVQKTLNEINILFTI
jgi:hypothetical protein